VATNTNEDAMQRLLTKIPSAPSAEAETAAFGIVDIAVEGERAGEVAGVEDWDEAFVPPDGRQV
jgi:hypothetical protein